MANSFITFWNRDNQQINIKAIDNGDSPTTYSLSTSGGGGGGGGAVTVADGANIAEGATTATAYSDATGATAGTVVGLLKGIFTKLAGYLSIATTSDKIAVTPVITSGSAYASGNCVGGVLTISNAVRVSGGTGVVQTVTIIDSSNQKAPLDIVLFNQSVVGTYTDKTALTINASDIPNIGTRLSISSSDYSTVGGVAIARVVFGSVIKAVGSRNMYAVVNTTGTPTYTSTSALILKFGILQD